MFSLVGSICFVLAFLGILAAGITFLGAIEESISKPAKNTTGALIAIIVLVLVSLALGGYGVYAWLNVIVKGLA